MLLGEVLLGQITNLLRERGGEEHILDVALFLFC
jgi:hypothetical protein